MYCAYPLIPAVSGRNMAIINQALFAVGAAVEVRS